MQVVTYVGELMWGMRQGLGKAYSETGALIFDGRWMADKRHGHGTAWSGVSDGAHDAPGLTYQGEWFADKQHGQGVLSGIQIMSEYRRQHLDDSCAQTCEYVGEFREGYRCGYGILRYLLPGSHAYRKLYQGEWKLGLRDGEGTSYNADGTLRYRGGVCCDTQCHPHSHTPLLLRQCPYLPMQVGRTAPLTASGPCTNDETVLAIWCNEVCSRMAALSTKTQP